MPPSLAQDVPVLLNNFPGWESGNETQVRLLDGPRKRAHFKWRLHNLKGETAWSYWVSWKLGPLYVDPSRAPWCQEVVQSSTFIFTGEHKASGRLNDFLNVTDLVNGEARTHTWHLIRNTMLCSTILCHPNECIHSKHSVSTERALRKGSFQFKCQRNQRTSGECFLEDLGILQPMQVLGNSIV